MNKTNDSYSEDEESTPEWAIELLKQHRDNTEKLRDEIRKKRSQLNKINDEMKTVNELLNYSDALMESATERLAQSNAEMESAVIEMEMGLEKMNQIRKKIDETEASRAKTDQYWKDLISKEIQTRSKYRDGRARKASSTKSSTKRLINNNGDQKRVQRKKNKEKLQK